MPYSSKKSSIAFLRLIFGSKSNARFVSNYWDNGSRYALAEKKYSSRYFLSKVF